MVCRLPVAFVLGQDDIFRWYVGEESDRRQFTAHLSMFIQRMIVIVHLGNSDKIRQ